MGWDWDSSRNWNEHRQHRHRHGGNWWIAPLVIFGLIILTHGWILVLPLMLLAGFAFFGFVLPKLAWHMHNSDWHGGEWAGQWNEMKRQHFKEWGEKRKRHFEGWDGRSSWHERYDEKPKHKNSDGIEYV